MYLKKQEKFLKKNFYKNLIILSLFFFLGFYFILSNFIFSETTVRADEGGFVLVPVIWIV